MDTAEDLKNKLKETEEKLYLAAEIGNKILEENKALQTEIENQTKDYFKNKEEFLQEKHVLQTKLEHKNDVEKNYLEEIEHLKSIIERQKADLREVLDYKTELSQWKAKCNSLELDNEQITEQSDQQKARISELQQALSELQQQLEERALGQLQQSGDEVEDLRAKLKYMEAEEARYSQAIEMLQSDVKELSMLNSNLKVNLSRKEENISEKETELASLYNALKKSRGEVVEIQAEIEAIKFENQDHRKKGNSLFGEVEDRRVEAEKKLISIETQYEGLKQQHDRTKQQLHKLKLQLAGLLNYSSNKTDKRYMEKLQDQLSQARSEVQTLTQMLESNKAASQSLSVGNQADPANETAEHFQSLLTAKDERYKALQQQAKMKHLMLLAESDKVVHCEQKLYSTERDLEQFKTNNVKLALRLEELQLKYEPEKIKKELRKRCTGIKEKIPCDDSKKRELSMLSDSLLSDNKENQAAMRDISSAEQLCSDGEGQQAHNETTVDTLMASLFQSIDADKEVKKTSKLDELQPASVEGSQLLPDTVLKEKKVTLNLEVVESGYSNNHGDTSVQPQSNTHGETTEQAQSSSHGDTRIQDETAQMLDSHQPDESCSHPSYDPSPVDVEKLNSVKFRRAEVSPDECKTQ